MNRLYKYFIFSLVSITLLCASSCKKDFLEVDPKGYLIAKATADYEGLLNATQIQASTTSIYLSDETAAQSDYFGAASVTTQRTFQFSDRIYNADQLPSMDYLQSNYIYNKVINEVMASTGGTEKQKLQLKAEAQVGRAICHLLFVNDFALPYKESSAASDLGVPIITTAEINKTGFKRATIKEVYDFILKDLNEALPNLASISHPFKASAAAAEGLLARTYLLMGKHSEALSHVEAAFKLLSGSFPVKLYDYNQTLAPNGEWQPVGFFGPSTPSMSEDKEVIFMVNRGVFDFSSANTFVTTPETGMSYDPSDFRLLFYSDTELFGSQIFPAGMKSITGFGRNVGVGLADLYLMRAELRARANNLSGAVQDLETLRKNRMPVNVASVPVATAGNRQSLVKFILDERIREFALSGMRWWDMRRLSVDTEFSNTVKYTHKIYNANGAVVQTFALDPKRFALKFGEKLLAENPELIENP